MTNESTVKDFAYESQIAEANSLANALLSGLIAEKITENKRNNKISANLKNLSELVNKYKIEIDMLRSLRIGSCNDILNAREDKSYEVQITVSEKLLKKIEEVLQTNVKHDVSRAISKEDIQAINDKMSLLKEIKEQLEQSPPSKEKELKEHLKVVNEIQDKLQNIMKSIEDTNIIINETEHDVVSMSSNALYNFI